MPRSAAWAGVSISGNTRPSGGVSCLYSLDVAAAVPGKAEIKAGRRRAVQFLRRNIVAHPIDLIVGEPQDPVFRIEIHTQRITNSAKTSRPVPSRFILMMPPIPHLLNSAILSCGGTL